ncbi:MAG: hypothetical protein DWQ37_11030 [Planctomycetota bacterium]|mgnify:CR=1 FL=1|nr:MAG: hypothetical protein DWQ37_11030 [Planctomycetota bacterium]
MRDPNPFLAEHRELTRRYFLKVGASSLAATGLLSLPRTVSASGSLSPNDAEKVERFESYLTPDERFADVSRGNPVPHGLPDEKKREVGMTRDTWKLEIISDPDPEHKVRLRSPLTQKDGTALDFPGLLKLAEKHAVRFAKIMTCLNLGCPLGMGIWEGVPLRELVMMTQPRYDVRRVFYYGYHNDDPQQMFRSSLPMGRILEDYYDLPPVIACYKFNGQWLSPERGGPVRIVVPEGYGFKSIKWITHVVLTNLPHANDTYAEEGNDVDSPLKSFAAFLSAPRKHKAGEPLPLSGYAQVGISGLRKVQVWIEPKGASRPDDDPYFTTAPWTDVEILPPPEKWGGGLPDDKLPLPIHGFDPETGRPLKWPLRLCAAHWAGVLPGLEPGRYTLRVRAVDENGIGQPLPRPSRKSGRAQIEQITLDVA